MKKWEHGNIPMQRIIAIKKKDGTTVKGEVLLDGTIVNRDTNFIMQNDDIESWDYLPKTRPYMGKDGK